MNTKTKKVVASIVLGTFVVTTATPVFASDEMAETLPVQPVVIEQIESGNMPADAEPYGLGTKVAKEIAEALVKNWSSVINFLEKMGMEKALLDLLDEVQGVLLDILDHYTGAVTTGEKILAEALVGVGFDEDDAEFWAEQILDFLL